MSSSEPAGFTTGNVSRYFGLASAVTTDLTTVGPAENIIQHDAVASNFATYIETNARITSTTFRFQQNGANSNQSVVFTAGTTGLIRDSSNTDTITAGDMANFSMRTAGSGSGIALRNFQLTLRSSNTREITIVGGPTYTRTFTASPFYGRIAGGVGSPAGSLALNQSVLGVAGVMSGMALNAATNTWTREYNVVLNNGGSNVNQTVNVPLTTTGWFQDTTNSDTVTATDLLAFRGLVGSGSGGSGSTNIRAISYLVTLPALAGLRIFMS